jgi:hypothetical protein
VPKDSAALVQLATTVDMRCNRAHLGNEHGHVLDLLVHEHRNVVARSATVAEEVNREVVREL